MSFLMIKRQGQPAKKERTPRTRLGISDEMPKRNTFWRKGMLAHRSLDGYPESLDSVEVYPNSTIAKSECQGCRARIQIRMMWPGTSLPPREPSSQRRSATTQRKTDYGLSQHSIAATEHRLRVQSVSGTVPVAAYLRPSAVPKYAGGFYFSTPPTENLEKC